MNAFVQSNNWTVSTLLRRDTEVFLNFAIIIIIIFMHEVGLN